MQRPGQASVAVDRTRGVAFVFDLGSYRDGQDIQFEDKPLLDRLEELRVRHIVFSCSHPHADHMGGIRALFGDPTSFLQDGDVKRPRFSAITVIDDGVTDSLYKLLKAKLPADANIETTRIPALGKNAFAGLSSPGNAVHVENIPYIPSAAAGAHGRSIVVKITLEGGETIIDFDDGDNAVVARVARRLQLARTRIDTFVVPHHGSRLGDIEPILALNPRRGVIAVNPQNPYGHPGGTAPAGAH